MMTFTPNHADASVALKTQVQDLTDRISRQEKRIQKIKVTGAGPCDDMEVVLADMMERRDAMQARLAEIEAAPVRAAPAKHAEPRLRLVPPTNGPTPRKGSINRGWSIKSFPGGVRLERVRSSRS